MLKENHFNPDVQEQILRDAEKYRKRENCHYGNYYERKLKETDVKIETASEDDAKELLDIYAPYILETAITFEYTIPSVDEFRERIRNTLQYSVYQSCS